MDYDGEFLRCFVNDDENDPERYPIIAWTSIRKIKCELGSPRPRSSFRFIGPPAMPSVTQRELSSAQAATHAAAAETRFAAIADKGRAR
jgi:hypothetical protein